MVDHSQSSLCVTPSRVQRPRCRATYIVVMTNSASSDEKHRASQNNGDTGRWARHRTRREESMATDEVGRSDPKSLRWTGKDGNPGNRKSACHRAREQKQSEPKARRTSGNRRPSRSDSTSVDWNISDLCTRTPGRPVHCEMSWPARRLEDLKRSRISGIFHLPKIQILGEVSRGPRCW